MKRFLGFLVLAALVATILVAGMRPDGKDAPTISLNRGPQAVVMVPIDALPIEETIRFHGITRGTNRTQLAFAIPGRLLTRPFQIGDRVEKDQILATLEAREHRLGLAEARAKLAALEARIIQAIQDQSRAKSLFEENAGTLEELEKTRSVRDQLQAQERASQAGIANLERRLKDAYLKAPFSGTVTQVLREPGEYLAAAMPVLTMSDEARIEVAIDLPEAFVETLEKEVPIEVVFPFLSDRKTLAELTSIGTSGKGRGSLFPAIVTLEKAPWLVPGLSAELLLTRKRTGAVKVPLSAVINPGGQAAYLFAAADGEARRVSIEVHGLQGSHVLISGEFKPGESVIVQGHQRLLDGDEVVAAKVVL